MGTENVGWSTIVIVKTVEVCMGQGCQVRCLSAFKQNWDFFETQFWAPCSRKWWIAPYTEASRAMSGLVCAVALAVLGIVASAGMVPVFPGFIREKSFRIVHDCSQLVPHVAFRIFAGAIGAIPIVGALIAIKYVRVPEVPPQTVQPAFVDVGVQVPRVQNVDAATQTENRVPEPVSPRVIQQPLKADIEVQTEPREPLLLAVVQPSASALSNSSVVQSVIPQNDLGSFSGGSDSEEEEPPRSHPKARRSSPNEVISNYNLRRATSPIHRSCSFCERGFYKTRF